MNDIEQKVWQNYRKKEGHETCKTCINIMYSSEDSKEEYSKNFSRKKKLVCRIGNFKITNLHVCDLYEED